jgi:glycosyltransferase involved in cell wall biosynthesis
MAIPDVRWFGRSEFDHLPVAALCAGGLDVATASDGPARIGICLGARSLKTAWRWSRTQRAPLALFIWDLPPWRLASGRPYPVVDLFGRLIAIPRPWARITRRPGAVSRVLYASARAATFWVPSTYTADCLRPYVGRDPTRVPYCYDAGRFIPDGTVRDPDVVVAVSRLISYKGQSDLLRAVALMTHPPRVRLIGRGDRADELRGLATGLGVRCTIESGVDDPGIVAAYRSAGVVACPSHFEGFGLTGIEALACHAQVVASDIPPHREFLSNGVRYFPPGEVATLAIRLEEARSSLPLPPTDLGDLTPAAAAARIHDALRPLLADR